MVSRTLAVPKYAHYITYTYAKKNELLPDTYHD